MPIDLMKMRNQIMGQQPAKPSIKAKIKAVAAPPAPVMPKEDKNPTDITQPSFVKTYYGDVGHIKEDAQARLMKKLGLKSPQDILNDPKMTLMEKTEAIRNLGPRMSGAFEQNFQAKVYDRQWPDKEEMQDIIQESKDVPTYGENIVQGAVQGLGQQIEKMRTAPRDGVDLRLLGEALRTAGSTADMSAMPRGESQMDRQAMLAALYQKLGDIGSKAAAIDIDKLKALRVQPDVFSRGMIDKLYTTPPKAPPSGGSYADKMRVKYGEAYEKSGLPTLAQSLEEIDRMIPGGLLGWNGQSIPGFTPTDKGLNAINAQALTDPAAQQLVSAVQDLVNNRIAAVSGKAVSAQEADRLKKALGYGALNTPLQLVSALRRVHEAVVNGTDRLARTYGNEAAAAYQGTTPIKQKPIVSQPGKSATPAAPTGEAPKQDILQRMRAIKENRKK